MSRRLGSKNRSTLVKELVERGADEAELLQLTYEDLEKKAAEAVAAMPPAPVVEKRILIDPAEASVTAKLATAKLTEMLTYFAPGGRDALGNAISVPADLRYKLRDIYVAPGIATANRIAKGTLDAFYARLLWLQKKGTISGPRQNDFRIWVA